MHAGPKTQVSTPKPLSSRRLSHWGEKGVLSVVRKFSFFVLNGASLQASEPKHTERNHRPRLPFCLRLKPPSPSLSPLVSRRRVSSCLTSDRPCFQPASEHRAINAGQREGAKGEGQHNWLLTEDSEFEKVEATARETGESCELRNHRNVCALLSVALSRLNSSCSICCCSAYSGVDV